MILAVSFAMWAGLIILMIRNQHSNKEKIGRLESWVLTLETHFGTDSSANPLSSGHEFHSNGETVSLESDEMFNQITRSLPKFTGVHYELQAKYAQEVISINAYKGTHIEAQGVYFLIVVIDSVVGEQIGKLPVNYNLWSGNQLSELRHSLSDVIGAMVRDHESKMVVGRSETIFVPDYREDGDSPA